MGWYGTEWYGMEWNRMERNGMEQFDIECVGLDWKELQWTASARNVLDWNGHMDWNGLKWTTMEGREWNGMRGGRRYADTATRAGP
jgi:hypothetical protein